MDELGIIKKPAKTIGGLTSGGCTHVTEHNLTSGQVRTWSECYDSQGNVSQVHPKMIDGNILDSQHYPPTKKEEETFNKNIRFSK